MKIPKDTEEGKLFIALFMGDNPIFKNQTRLAEKLLENEKSFFKAEKGESAEKINTKMVNLKSLLSQIFNPNARRKIKNEFIESVCLVVTEQLKSKQFSSEEIEAIVSSIRSSLIAIKESPKSLKKGKQETDIGLLIKECQFFYFVGCSCDLFRAIPDLENLELSKGKFFVPAIFPKVQKKIIERKSEIFEMKGNFLDFIFFRNYNWKPQVRGFLIRNSGELLIELNEGETSSWEYEIYKNKLMTIVYNQRFIKNGSVDKV